MGIRLRGLIGLAFVTIFVLVTISVFIPQEGSDSALARGLRNGRQYFSPDSKLSPTVELTKTGTEEILVASASPSHRPSSHLYDPLASEVEQTPKGQEQHLQQSNHPSQHEQDHSKASNDIIETKHESAAASDDIRILIGVMSPFWSSARRHIIREAYRKFPKNLPVDIVFVQGNMTSDNKDNVEHVLAMQRTVVGWENASYHDIMHVDCKENLEYGKTFEYLKKVGDEFGHKYTHVMKTDDDSFVNIPALVEVIRANRHQKHFYWGTTWKETDRQHEEMWGSGYVLSIDLIKWIATSDIPPQHQWGYEDYQVCYWLIVGGMDDNFVVNRTAFAGYPWPELGDRTYKQENEIRPFDRWTLVTHPLKEDFMWVETAEYYLSLDWPQFS